MALWRTLTWKSKEEMIDFLNGNLIGSVNLHEGAAVDGLTIIIDPGGGNVTVTFAPAKSRDWTLEEIVDHINADAGIPTGTVSAFVRNSIAPRPPDRRISIGWDPAVIIRSTGTANALLGYSTTADETQVITPATAVEQIFRNVDGQDTWTAIVYS